MKRMLINATHPDEVRVALVDGFQLLDYDIEDPKQKRKKADIYKGIITSIEPSLGAVFVNYGSERHGFLPLKEISREYFLNHDQDHLDTPNINSVLKIGQELVVQVDKEERGNKGAALTTFISLAGSYLVLMPNNPRAGGISRRIDGEERDQLRESINQLEIPEGMGVIVRTAGVSKGKEELQWDLNILLRYWEAIKQAAVARPGPYLIHQEGDVIIRAIRDYLRQDIGEVIIDETEAYEKARQHLNQVRPEFVDRIKFYKDNTPLFSRYQVEQQIEAAYQREVRLPSGGSLVIDQTEALVSIDINSSRATKGKSIEETALNTNLEAAEEIARQLRIRDIGGLIVIDFIDMTPVRNQREVENHLRNALSMDRARIQVGRISRFGLLEMSRQRLRSSLTKVSQVTCARCSGKGTIRSVESSALSIIHMVQEQSLQAQPGSEFHLQLPVDVATYIMNEKRSLIEDIEKQNPVKVLIIPNQHLFTPNYVLKQVTKEELSKDASDIPSYKMVQTNKAEEKPRRQEAAKAEVEPAITQFLSNEANLGSNPHHRSFIAKLFKKLFASKPATKSSSFKLAQPSRVRIAAEPDDNNEGNNNRDRNQSRNRNNQQRPRTNQGTGSGNSNASGGNEQQNRNQRGGNRNRRGNRGGSRRQQQPGQANNANNLETGSQQEPAVQHEHRAHEAQAQTFKPRDNQQAATLHEWQAPVTQHETQAAQPSPQAAQPREHQPRQPKPEHKAVPSAATEPSKPAHDTSHSHAGHTHHAPQPSAHVHTEAPAAPRHEVAAAAEQPVKRRPQRVEAPAQDTAGFANQTQRTTETKSED